MKKLTLIMLLLSSLPVFANVEICNNEYCIDYKEPLVKSIETISNPYYGVKITLTNGHVATMQSDTRASAVLMLDEAYSSLKDYYNWSDDYFYNLLEKQDKAKLMIH